MQQGSEFTFQAEAWKWLVGVFLIRVSQCQCLVTALPLPASVLWGHPEAGLWLVTQPLCRPLIGHQRLRATSWGVSSGQWPGLQSSSRHETSTQRQRSNATKLTSGDHHIQGTRNAFPNLPWIDDICLNQKPKVLLLLTNLEIIWSQFKAEHLKVKQNKCAFCWIGEHDLFIFSTFPS